MDRAVLTVKRARPMFTSSIDKTPERSSTRAKLGSGTWCEQYGRKHRPIRIKEFSPGIVPPKRVRIYARNGHYLVQWWDSAVRETLNERVNGDLIDALTRARQIDQRLADFNTVGKSTRHFGHLELVQAFLADLDTRADAGTLSPETGRRYGSALGHYLGFTDTPAVSKSHPQVHRVDRNFALRLSAHLEQLMVSPNGCAGGVKRRMQASDFVLDAVRAMYEWASDPDRGNLLPDGFRSPFRRGALQRRRAAGDCIGEPDITMTMAADFLRACDDYQLRLFAPMVFYPLRAAEPVFMFHEQIDSAFLGIACIRELDYLTKGVRNKLLPLLDPIAALLRSQTARAQGLVYLRRSVIEASEKLTLAGVGLAEIIREYQIRCTAAHNPGARQRALIRDEVMFDAGAMTYKLIQREFLDVANPLGWPKSATLKDFRHLANTTLANAGMPEHERRYLMGHAPGSGRAAITTYTHVNRLAEHFRTAVEKEFGPVTTVLHHRLVLRTESSPL